MEWLVLIAAVGLICFIASCFVEKHVCDDNIEYHEEQIRRLNQKQDEDNDLD